MSRLYLTPGSRQTLARLVITGGSDALLLHRPANEVRATLEVAPGSAYQGSQTIEAVLRTHGTVNALTLRRGDSANDQHLAEWIESIANGTQDSAEASPQQAESPALLPCAKCDGEAICYDYAAPGPDTAFLHGVKCRYNECFHVEGSPTAVSARGWWNSAQRMALQAAAEQAADLSGDTTTDMVNHPPHYTGHPSGVECIEVAEHLPFCLGNAFKYLFRRDDKAALRENIEKAVWYIRRQRELTPEGLPHAYLPKAARVALAAIVASEPVPYRHVMDMVGSGRMLDLAERLLIAALDDLPF